MNSSPDKELIELAAAAAGIDGAWDPFRNQFRKRLGLFFLGDPWDPINVHFDASDLRKRLNITMSWEHYNGDDYAFAAPPGTHQGYDELIEPAGTIVVAMAAMRRAIVRAAASMVNQANRVGAVPPATTR